MYLERPYEAIAILRWPWLPIKFHFRDREKARTVLRELALDGRNKPYTLIVFARKPMKLVPANNVRKHLRKKYKRKISFEKRDHTPTRSRAKQ